MILLASAGLPFMPPCWISSSTGSVVVTSSPRSAPCSAGSEEVRFASRRTSALIRMPSFAIHCTWSSGMPGSHSPPRASTRPSRTAGIDTWCSAASSQASLKAGEPEEPSPVSVS